MPDEQRSQPTSASFYTEQISAPAATPQPVVAPPESAPLAEPYPLQPTIFYQPNAPVSTPSPAAQYAQQVFAQNARQNNTPSAPPVYGAPLAAVPSAPEKPRRRLFGQGKQDDAMQAGNTPPAAQNVPQQDALPASLPLYGLSNSEPEKPRRRLFGRGTEQDVGQIEDAPPATQQNVPQPVYGAQPIGAQSEPEKPRRRLFGRKEETAADETNGEADAPLATVAPQPEPERVRHTVYTHEPAASADATQEVPLERTRKTLYQHNAGGITREIDLDAGQRALPLQNPDGAQQQQPATYEFAALSAVAQIQNGQPAGEALQVQATVSEPQEAVPSAAWSNDTQWQQAYQSASAAHAAPAIEKPVDAAAAQPSTTSLAQYHSTAYDVPAEPTRRQSRAAARAERAAEKKAGETIMLPEMSDSAKEPQAMHYAGFFVRLFAYMMDMALVGLLWGAISLGLRVLGFGTALSQPAFFLWSGFTVINVLLTVCYFVVTTALMGATPGKRLLRLRVVDVGGKKPRFFNVLYRETVGRILSSILLFGYIMLASDDKNRGFHDMLSDTRVVYNLP